MVENATREMFPLRLAPLEQFLVLDDQENCPRTSFIELHFASPLQSDRLADALCQTVHAHPLLASRLTEIAGKLYWDYDPEFVPTLLDPDHDPMVVSMPDCFEPGPAPIDLHRQPGCRYWYQDDFCDSKSRLIIQLHHATTDGVGLRRVLIDTLLTYAGLTDAQFQGGTKVKRRERLSVDRLRHRGDFSHVHAKPLKVPLSRWQKVRNAIYFHFHRPTPLRGSAASATQTRDETNGEPLLHHVFDVDTSQSVMRRCREHDIAINDLALSILFRVCRMWNQMHGSQRPETRLRLL
ncbi:MAG: hypothetical protein AAF745_00090, partial [Planctomycetota bacterium]